MSDDIVSWEYMTRRLAEEIESWYKANPEKAKQLSWHYDYRKENEQGAMNHASYFGDRRMGVCCE